jgi:hypothetical protein
MAPFVPNDKYDVSGLVQCWNYVRKNISDIETAYFSELAVKTYELFLVYNEEDVIPKELIYLTSSLSQFKNVNNYDKYSTPDIIVKVTLMLLDRLINGFNFTHFTENKKWEFKDNSFGIMYHEDLYYLDATTFDISPIKNKQK